MKSRDVISGNLSLHSEIAETVTRLELEAEVISVVWSALPTFHNGVATSECKLFANSDTSILYTEVSVIDKDESPQSVDCRFQLVSLSSAAIRVVSAITSWCSVNYQLSVVGGCFQTLQLDYSQFNQSVDSKRTVRQLLGSLKVSKGRKRVKIFPLDNITNK